MNINYNKFPILVRQAFDTYGLVFPEGTMDEYKNIHAFRVISRKHNDNTDINREDFRSYYELYAESPTKPNGFNESIKDIAYYSTSLFSDHSSLNKLMKLPRKNKIVINGYVGCDGGPAKVNNSTNHIDWWMYEDVDLSSFSIYEEDKWCLILNILILMARLCF